jgi:hypothetical protein
MDGGVDTRTGPFLGCDSGQCLATTWALEMERDIEIIPGKAGSHDHHTDGQTIDVEISLWGISVRHKSNQRHLHVHTKTIRGWNDVVAYLSCEFDYYRNHVTGAMKPIIYPKAMNKKETRKKQDRKDTQREGRPPRTGAGSSPGRSIRWVERKGVLRVEMPFDDADDDAKRPTKEGKCSLV